MAFFIKKYFFAVFSTTLVCALRRLPVYKVYKKAGISFLFAMLSEKKLFFFSRGKIFFLEDNLFVTLKNHIFMIFFYPSFFTLRYGKNGFCMSENQIIIIRYLVDLKFF